MNRELVRIIENLTPKQKEFLSHFDVEIDSGRSIANQELFLRTTAGKNAVCGNSSYYEYIQKFVEMELLSKDKDSSIYFVTDLGWNVWIELTKRPILGIPVVAKREMESLLYRMANLDFFNINEHALKSWSQKFIIYIQKLSNLLDKVGDDAQTDLVNNLALVLWNNFYQPKLISRNRFDELLELRNQISQGYIFVICKYFDWAYFILDDDLWFIGWDYKFWQERYLDLIKHYFYLLPPEELQINSRDFEKIVKATLHGKTFNAIQEKAIKTIAEEILFQKGHFWSQKYKQNAQWLYPRLITILVR